MFQKNIVEKYLSKLDKELLEQKYDLFCSIFKNEKKIENIRNSKEEQYQEGFIRDLFVSVLGYTIKPEENYNILTELKNEVANKSNSKKSDGAICEENNENKIRAVIELKGTDTTDLDKVAFQAFSYKNFHNECNYVIVSNFERLRIYVETQIEFEEFNLFTLSFERFCILYLLLELNQLKADIPLKLKHETLSEEKQITDNFYADYSTFKRLLFEDLCENNLQSEECHAELVSASDDEIPNQVRNDDGKINKLLLFKKTQKLLDRILFILFCEDRNLLPPNSIAGIISDYQKLKEMGYGQPLYNVFKTYFDRIDKGYKNESDSSKDVFAYNGGLFKTDEVLDNIKVGDDVLYIHSKRLADYDFESQISVDILGRIFENSLTEIEEVQKEIEAEIPNRVRDDSLPVRDDSHAQSKTTRHAELDSASKTTNIGKRKKDGVFYTPEYITKYIVENTIGKLCEDKRNELNISDEEVAKAQTKKQKDTLNVALHEYQKWLFSLKILDPACGSGAFLTAALTQLKTEHRRVFDFLHAINNDSMMFEEYSDNSILENNLYGVDINEESVEIAKLSLWLHTAKKNRKLTTLNGKIKCGNSLIDDPTVAGEKAFKWEEEFPEVFAKGGFDVVIGNPPYVRVQQLDYATIDLLKKTYKTALKRIDISLCFIEKSRNLIKNNGLVSFITSNQFLTTEYGQAMRNFLLSEFFLTECVDFGDLPIFKDAMTYVSIFKFTKEKQDSFGYKKIKDIQIAKTGHYSVFKKIELSQLNDSNWNLESSDLKKIHNKIESVSLKIDEIGNAWYGIVTGADSVFIFDKETYQKTNIEREIFLPLMRAQNCSKNFCSDAEKFVLYPYKIENNNTVLINEAELSSKYPNAYNYLLEHKDELEARKDSRSTFKGRADWYCLTRFGQLEIFRKNKILTPGEVKEHKFCINNSCAGYSGARVFAIVIDDENFDLKYVLCLLNSDLMKSYLQSFSSLKAGGYYSYSSNILNRTPIKNISLEAQQSFIALADKMLSLNENFQKKSTNFLKVVKQTFALEKVSAKMESFYELDFDGFLKELKQKVTPKTKLEWLEVFEETKKSLQEIQSQIAATDKEINALVYKLYDLTDEEIKIVEGR